ncbi:MAG: nicotinamide mononucleotide transporter [Actinobacteria bacterium]|nr:nicotinamide mononucleotide transporter [Actinomycetota bacterium]
MRIGKGLNVNTFFTAWEYQVSYLEFISVLTSLTAVTLGARGTRWAWPWWILSSTLYGLFFYRVDLLASAILQLIFIAAAIWGWFGWKPSGVEPRYMTKNERAIWLFAAFVLWLLAAPLLANIGAAASWPDSLLLVASAVTQLIMVRQFYETWSLWFAINLFGTWHYARQEFFFTALLYSVFALIAIYGLVRWLKIKR